MIASWSFPNDISIGPGSLARLPEACSELGMNHPLLVTDRVLHESGLSGIPIRVMDEAGLGRSVFFDVNANPDEATLNAGRSLFIEGHFDGIIAFGGGSAMDVGKLLAFMAHQTRPVWDFEDIGDQWRRADDRNIAPVIAIPTTAGTGSEVGRAAVLTDPRIPAKKVIFHPGMLPEIVLADPELCMTMPPEITAGTGMDAFAHCLEAYCANGYHPMCRGIALEGMRLVRENLMVAYRDGGNLKARTNMMSAAIMGAVSFQRGLGAIHALSHPLGALHGCHHGTTNAVIMPHVMMFNQPAIHDQITDAANYLGIVGGFAGFVDFVKGLCVDLEMPISLRGLGIPSEGIETLAELALADPSCDGNPVKLDRDNIMRLAKSCFEPAC